MVPLKLTVVDVPLKLTVKLVVFARLSDLVKLKVGLDEVKFNVALLVPVAMVNVDVTALCPMALMLPPTVIVPVLKLKLGVLFAVLPALLAKMTTLFLTVKLLIVEVMEVV